MPQDETSEDNMLRRAKGGDEAARAELFARHRDRLKRLVLRHFEELNNEAASVLGIHKSTACARDFIWNLCRNR